MTTTSTTNTNARLTYTPEHDPLHVEEVANIDLTVEQLPVAPGTLLIVRGEVTELLTNPDHVDGFLNALGSAIGHQRWAIFLTETDGPSVLLTPQDADTLEVLEALANMARAERAALRRQAEEQTTTRPIPPRPEDQPVGQPRIIRTPADRVDQAIAAAIRGSGPQDAQRPPGARIFPPDVLRQADEADKAAGAPRFDPLDYPATTRPPAPSPLASAVLDDQALEDFLHRLQDGDPDTIAEFRRIATHPGTDAFLDAVGGPGAPEPVVGVPGPPAPLEEPGEPEEPSEAPLDGDPHDGLYQ